MIGTVGTVMLGAAAGCDPVFVDKASGKLARRPELAKALMVARAVTSSW